MRDHFHFSPLFFAIMMPTAGRVGHIWHAAGHHRQTAEDGTERGVGGKRRGVVKEIYMRYIKGC